jgi:hypothetical protein
VVDRDLALYEELFEGLIHRDVDALSRGNISSLRSKDLLRKNLDFVFCRCFAYQTHCAVTHR